MKKPHGVPGTPGIPQEIQMQVPDLSAPRPVPPTMHETEFHGCAAGIYVELDAENICQGYRLLIMDPREAHKYLFRFDQELFEQWKSQINEFPNVGDKVEEEESSNGNAG